MTESGEELHGRYVIRTFSSGTKVSARAFAVGKSVAFAEGKSMDAAISSIRSLLNERDIQERDARQDGIPTSREFADAFARLGKKVGKHHWLMLRALHGAPSSTMTATELAASAGYPNFRSGNERFVKLGRMLTENLEFQPDLWPDGSPNWISILATVSI